MIGIKLLSLGMALLVIGLGCIAAHSMEMVEFSGLPVLGAAITVIGVGIMVAGIFATLGSAVGDHRRGIHAGDGAVFSVGLLRCMLAIIIADKHVDEAEIEQTARVYKHLTGTAMDKDTIRNTANALVEEGTDINTELQNIAPTLGKNPKKQIVIASLYILAADGHMDERELSVLENIREGLEMK
ncbi:MAG: TerB family tellurite resistance protein, partial [Alphaproteobacteria bacterium]